MKFKLILFSLFLPIAFLSVAFRPHFVPYEARPVMTREKHSILYEFLVDDLDGDGVDEAIYTFNKDFNIYKRANFELPKDVTESLKYIIISNHAGTKMLFRSELNSTMALVVTNVMDADGDGIKEIFLTKVKPDTISLCLYDWINEDVRELLMFTKETDCGDRFWDGSCGVYGIFKDKDNRTMVLGKIVTGFCRYPRALFTFSLDDPKRTLNLYRLGAYLNNPDLVPDGKNDGKIIVVSCSSTCNGAVDNGTADTCGYILAFDLNLKPIWRRVIPDKFCSVRSVHDVFEKNGKERIIAAVSHQTSNRYSSAYLIDPTDGTVIDSALVDGFYDSIFKLRSPEGGEISVLAPDQMSRTLLKITVNDDRLTLKKLKLPFATPTSLIGYVKNFYEEYMENLAVINPSERYILILDHNLEPEIRARLNHQIRPSLPRFIRCQDGVRRLIYRDGPNLVVSDIVRSSILAYALRAYWAVIAYVTISSLYLAYRRFNRPDTLKGKARLLEHMRVSSHHGELSIVSSLSRLSRLIEMASISGRDNAGLSTRISTAIQVHHLKWEKDLKEIINICERYGIFRDEARRLKALEKETARIIEWCENAAPAPGDTSQKDADEKASRLKSLSGEINTLLSNILSALDREVSCDPVEAVRKVEALFSEKFTSAGVSFELRVEDEKGEQVQVNRSPETHGIRARITEVELLTILDNLLSNALKALQGAGEKRIEVKIIPRRYTVDMVMKDTGCGIHPDIIDSIFQLGATTKSRGGTGLYYIKKTIERYGGTVTVHSEGEGKGAEFTLSIPVSRSAT